MKKEKWREKTEKIGKLLKLLNEYENTDNWENLHQVEFRESKIISKKFGFIKWLVENEKIDFSNLKIDELTSGTDLFYSFSKAEVLLMLLAIQDEPIEFLIGILK